MAKSLINLDIIATGLCDDIGDSVMKYKFRFMRYLLDAYRELNVFISPSFEVKTAILKTTNAIQMPDDFMYETKVGVMKNGRIAILSLDNDVRKEILGDTETQSYLDSIWSGFGNYTGYYFYNSFRGNTFIGELYGIGRSIINNGTYNVDRNNGIIYIGSLTPKDTEIVIEYKSDGISNGLKLVPIEMKESMEFYAKHKYYMDKNPNLGMANYNLYKKSYNKLQRYYNWQDSLYATTEINKMFSPSNY